MGALISISIKGSNGSYYNYTISISDTTNEFGNNVSMWVQQTQEEINVKAKKQYVGNGKVFWTDNKIFLANPKKDSSQGINISGMENNFNNVVQNNFSNKQEESINKSFQENKNEEKEDFDFYNMTEDDLPF